MADIQNNNNEEQQDVNAAPVDDTQQVANDPNAAPADDGAQADAGTDENPVAADVDPYVESDDQVNLNAQTQQDRLQASTPSLMSSRDGAPAQAIGNLQLADGSDTGVAIDSAAQVDALDPDGEADMSFASGNFDQLNNLPNAVAEKSSTITHTVIPLIGAALIELLGNSAAFTCESFNSSFNVVEGEPTYSVEATFSVELWLGNDIPQDAIAQDSKYVLDRINVVKGVTFNKCEIDCNEGKLTVGFTI